MTAINVRTTDAGHTLDRASGARDSGRRSKSPYMGTLTVAAGAMLVIGVLLAGCSSEASGQTSSTSLFNGVGPANAVTVNGVATVTSPPDEAVVVLTLENDAATAPAAMDATSVQSNQLLAKLKSLGIEDAAIQTSSVTLYPVRTYDPQTGKETLTGYRATNSVKVTLKDSAGVAKVLAASVETGVTLVSGPDWRLRDDSQAINEALKRAVEHARAKAETLAAAGGASIGEVISITEGSVQIPVPMYRMAEGSAMDSAKVSEPAISSGALDVTATVTITYALKR